MNLAKFSFLQPNFCVTILFLSSIPSKHTVKSSEFSLYCTKIAYKSAALIGLHYSLLSLTT